MSIRNRALPEWDMSPYLAHNLNVGMLAIRAKLSEMIEKYASKATRNSTAIPQRMKESRREGSDSISHAQISP